MHVLRHTCTLSHACTQSLNKKYLNHWKLLPWEPNLWWEHSREQTSKEVSDASWILILMLLAKRLQHETAGKCLIAEQLLNRRGKLLFEQHHKHLSTFVQNHSLLPPILAYYGQCSIVRLLCDPAGKELPLWVESGKDGRNRKGQ